MQCDIPKPLKLPLKYVADKSIAPPSYAVPLSVTLQELAVLLFLPDHTDMNVSLQMKGHTD